MEAGRGVSSFMHRRAAEPPVTHNMTLAATLAARPGGIVAVQEPPTSSTKPLSAFSEAPQRSIVVEAKSSWDRGRRHQSFTQGRFSSSCGRGLATKHGDNNPKYE